MLARTGPPLERAPTWMRLPVLVAVDVAGAAAAVSVRRCGERGTGPDRSGNSLAYSEDRATSVRAAVGSGSGASGLGDWNAAGAAVPVM